MTMKRYISLALWQLDTRAGMLRCHSTSVVSEPSLKARLRNAEHENPPRPSLTSDPH